jgi:NAD(P)-dependent dehydrogenase (short-subunit alcohol dehydrogenase family)
MWLTGRLVPDHKTIADFRKDNGTAIRKVCARFVALCRTMGLLTQASVAIDGSKFRAVNNRDRNFTRAKMERRMAQIEESVALVANAGISKAATIEETTIDDFDKLFAVNVRAPFFLVQQLLPILTKGSSVVFLSSLGARAVVGTIPAYAATKGAIDTLVKHFASMLGARGIRVNAVAPGVVETDMSSFTKSDAGRDYVFAMQAFKRLAQPDDIAGVVAFLASEEARWITGDTIHVDGGSKL